MVKRNSKLDVQNLTDLKKALLGSCYGYTQQ